MSVGVRTVLDMTTALDDSAASATPQRAVDSVAERERTRDRIEAEIAGAAGVLNAAHGRLARAVADALESEIWTGYGIRSVEHWLTLQVGVSREHAEKLVRVAHRVGELPVTVDSLASGAMTLDQAAVIAAKVPAHNDAEVAGLAARTAVPQLQTLIRKYHFSTPPSGVDADPAADHESDTAMERDRDSEAAADSAVEDADSGETSESGAAAGDTAAPTWCRAGWTDDGRYRLTYDAPADAGALVEQALREAKDRLFQLGQADITSADAFDALVTAGLEHLTRQGPGSRIDKYRVYLHLDLDQLAWINGGPTLPASLRDKLTCDGVVRPLWHSHGKPVNVGRAQRIVPMRTRRLIEDRDRVCRFPGCTATGYLEVHHRVHWSRGGATDMHNLLCLCPAHHDAVHRGEYTIDGDPDQPSGLDFTDPNGRRLGPRRPIPPTEPLPTPRQPYRRPYGERINLRDVWFSPPPTLLSRN
jgi:hypothetical protein